MNIIKQRETVTSVTYSHSFDWEDMPGAGFTFDCDEHGKFIAKNECSAATYAACLTGSIDGRRILDRGIERREHSYTEPAIGLCNHCPREVHLLGFTNTCECGADYNMSGQELAPREQWGEETGEDWTDCV